MEEKHGSVTISKANPAPAGGGEMEPWAGVFRNRKDPEMANQPEIEMEALKTHMGATGGQVRKGARYVLTSEVAAVEHVRLGLGERLSPEAPSEEGAEGGEADELSKPWPLTLTPEQYLDKYGKDAKHSAHAQAVIEREGKT